MLHGKKVTRQQISLQSYVCD